MFLVFVIMFLVFGNDFLLFSFIFWARVNSSARLIKQRLGRKKTLKPKPGGFLRADLDQNLSA